MLLCQQVWRHMSQAQTVWDEADEYIRRIQNDVRKAPEQAGSGLIMQMLMLAQYSKHVHFA